MNRTLELGGWVLAIGAIAAAVLVRHRMTSLVDAVARTCHELRGPLTAARLGLVLALRGDQPVDVRLRALELDLSRATLAVEDLAHVSAPGWRQGASGAQDASGGEEVDVAPLLAEAVEAWRGLAIAHGAELHLAATDGRAVVAGERLRLAQAIGNLVANSVEHGGGRVEVAGRVEGERVLISVRDEGPGIRPELAAWLGRPVRRRARRPGGSGPGRGRGLLIARTVAAAQGGRLTAEPSERGASLVLELPLAGPRQSVRALSR